MQQRSRSWWPAAPSVTDSSGECVFFPQLSSTLQQLSDAADLACSPDAEATQDPGTASGACSFGHLPAGVDWWRAGPILRPRAVHSSSAILSRLEVSKPVNTVSTESAGLALREDDAPPTPDSEDRILTFTQQSTVAIDKQKAESIEACSRKALTGQKDLSSSFAGRPNLKWKAKEEKLNRSTAEVPAQKSPVAGADILYAGLFIDEHQKDRILQR